MSKASSTKPMLLAVVLLLLVTISLAGQSDRMIWCSDCCYFIAGTDTLILNNYECEVQKPASPPDNYVIILKMRHAVHLLRSKSYHTVIFHDHNREIQADGVNPLDDQKPRTDYSFMRSHDGHIQMANDTTIWIFKN